MQAYYGTDENGHLVPRTFACASCHLTIDMDAMVLLPAEGVDEGQTMGQEVPWLQKDKGGFWKRWFGTIGWALVKPQQLMRLLPANDTENSGWIFALFTMFITTLGVMLPFQLMVFFFVFGAGPGSLFGMCGMPCAAVFLGPIIAAVVILLWASITHALLRLSGKTAYPLERTCQAMCYSCGANIFTAVPCLGWYLGWVWWLISAVLMVKEGQQVSGWRASLATLAAPGLVIAGCVSLIVWQVSSGALPAPLSMVPTAASTTLETSLVAQALLSDGAGQSGAPAGHVIEVMERDWLIADQFVSAHTDTYVDAIPVAAGVTLQDFELLPDARRKVIVQKLNASLLIGTLAYRFGDFVFTHHGTDVMQADPKLWLVIWSPDPDVNGPPNPADWMAVGKADGTAQAMRVQDFPAALQAQNAVRAAEALPPLKNPLAVTHARPEVWPRPPAP